MPPGSGLETALHTQVHTHACAHVQTRRDTSAHPHTQRHACTHVHTQMHTAPICVSQIIVKGHAFS